jgi:NHLM bacteriocin system ABC transporter peptidase/ATP-binding protein
MEATECGAASLSMIFAYFGKHIPLEQMRIETGVSRDGCNARNIMRAARKYGLECHAYHKELDELKEMQLPCIIHWNFNHFVVFEGFKGKYAYINDPAVGRRKLTIEELDDSFTGIVLTFATTNQFKKERKKRTWITFVQTRLKGQLGVIFKLFYIGLLLVFPGLILPVLSQIFIDDILCNGYKDWLTKILVAMGGCIVLKVALSYYRSLLLQKLKSKMTLISGKNFLSHMFGLPISFFDQRYTGDLVSRIQNNSDVNEFLAGDFAETILNIMIAIFYLIILFLYSPVMTMIGLIQVVISLTAIFLSNKFVANSTVKLQMTGGKLYGTICAGLNITDTIKASGVESEYSERILGHQANYASLTQKLNRFQQVVGIIPQVAGNISDVALLLIGGILVINGRMTMGMLVAFNSLFDSFCQPINSLVSFIKSFQTLKSNIKRVEDIELYKQSSQIVEEQTKLTLKHKINGDVELRDISFGYSTLKPALIENFGFKLRCGESIAFVGASGCGKSTIAKVISGLYQPWSGKICFDGVDIKNIPKEVYNASVAMVNQNITLFSGTIRENISMWNPAILEEDIVDAAKAACIHEFIMQQPGGYDYMLIENGANLSGGQRQRMEIARALATKPSILIMDEATSALDPIVEKNIMDNLRRRGCTCIIVAHRLSAIRDCNQIVVMKQGKIIEVGTHRSLMAENGYYRSFIQNA